MQITQRPDLSTRLLTRAMASDYVPVGNAVASVKELTLSLRKAWYLKQKEYHHLATHDEEFDDVAMLRILVGVGFGKLANRVSERRVEIPSDVGIISGRIDLIEEEITTAGTVEIPCEIKCTWAKPSDLPPQPQYVEQLAGYCGALGSLVGRLYVMHVGGYRPEPKCYEIMFTPDELAMWTGELRDRAAIKCGDKLPSVETCWTWECRSCPVYHKNGGPCFGGASKTTGFFSA